MKKLFKLTSGFVRTDLLFLFVLILVMIYIFSPVIRITFEELDWMELEYHLQNIPTNQNHLLFWIKYYLTYQYGTTYALIGIAGFFLKASMSAHYIMNVFLRMVAAISLYSLASWWTSRKNIAFIAGLFFSISIPGIENTLWVIQFVAYIAVILLCLNLYFWRRFHINPNLTNLKLSALFFSITLFIAHIRLHALPLIIVSGELYEYFSKQRKSIYSKLKLQHVKLLGLVFLGLYLSSTGLKINSQIFRTVPIYLLIRALIDGYPPILHSFFLFLGNVILPSNAINLLNSYTSSFLNLKNLGQISSTVSVICLILSILNLYKKRYLPASIFLLATLYPLSVYFNRNNLFWEQGKIISTAIAGSSFFLLILMSIDLLKTRPKEGTLSLLGLTIVVSHLIFPWIAFPQAETNVQAAYATEHRYYIVPLAGMSIIWGVVFSYFWRIFVNSTLYIKRLNRKFIFSMFKMIASITTICLLFLVLIMNGLATRTILAERTKHFDKNREQQLWGLIRPLFEDINDKKRGRIIYIEGDLNDKDKSIVIYFLRHHLINELGYGSAENKYNITFTLNREIIKRILEKDPALYTEYNLQSSFSEADFMALRINKNHIQNIKKEILNEIKAKNNL